MPDTSAPSRPHLTSDEIAEFGVDGAWFVPVARQCWCGHVDKPKWGVEGTAGDDGSSTAFATVDSIEEARARLVELQAATPEYTHWEIVKYVPGQVQTIEPDPHATLSSRPPARVTVDVQEREEWRFILSDDACWNGPVDEATARHLAARLLARGTPDHGVTVTFQRRTALWADLPDGEARIRVTPWTVDPADETPTPTGQEAPGA